MLNFSENIALAAQMLRQADYAVVFTGAGISVESGIPPFRGNEGLWSQYDPQVLDIDYFYRHPAEAWSVIRELFYDFFGKAKANAAHRLLGKFEKAGLIKAVITQNIDNLHQEGGSRTVYEFHGTAQHLLCTKCSKSYAADSIDMSVLPPLCQACGALLKPDFVFFGEDIPSAAYHHSAEAVQRADVLLIVGTSGEVVPASMFPYQAKKSGATIIEINPESSNFTAQITDIFLQGKATEVTQKLDQAIFE